MNNVEPVKAPTGTHPLITMLLFGSAIAAVITFGSYVSKQRSAERELQIGVVLPVEFLR